MTIGLDPTPHEPPAPRVVPPHEGERIAPADAARAYAVHAFTASGVAFAFLATAEVGESRRRSGLAAAACPAILLVP